MEQLAVRFELPDHVIALVPMRNVVLFPHVLMPITVGRVKSIAAVEHMRFIPVLRSVSCCRRMPLLTIPGSMRCALSVRWPTSCVISLQLTGYAMPCAMA